MKENLVIFDLGLKEKLYFDPDNLTFRQEREEKTHQILQVLEKNVYHSEYPNLDYFFVNQEIGAGILLRGDNLGMTVARATLGVFVPRKGFECFLLEPTYSYLRVFSYEDPIEPEKKWPNPNMGLINWAGISRSAIQGEGLVASEVYAMPGYPPESSVLYSRFLTGGIMPIWQGSTDRNFKKRVVSVDLSAVLDHESTERLIPMAEFLKENNSNEIAIEFCDELQKSLSVFFPMKINRK